MAGGGGHDDHEEHGHHKKHKHEEHANHEAWVISYADMVTLLFALFVVLYAISQTNVQKLKQVKASIGRAFGPSVGLGPSALAPSHEEDPTDSEGREQIDAWVYAPIFGALSPPDPVDPRLEHRLLKLLRDELDVTLNVNRRLSQAVNVALGENVMVISFRRDGLFVPGGTELAKGARGVLDDVATHLKTRGGACLIESMSGSHGSRLANERASALLRALITRRVAPDRVLTLGRARSSPWAKWGRHTELRLIVIGKQLE